MKKISLAILVLMIFAGICLPGSATALSAQACKQLYNNKTVSQQQLAQGFNMTDCSESCSTKTVTNGGRAVGSKITCRNQKDKDTSGGANSVNAGSLSASCADEGDICVKQLPRTNFGMSTVQNIISIVIGIIAAISVLFIAIGGLRYVFSQGDPQAVGKAKGTIIYAAVGLIVAIVAQGIVALVINTVLS